MSEAPTERVIGELVGKMDMIAASLNHHIQKSEEGRQKIYVSLEAQQRDIHDMKRDIKEMDARVTVIEPKLKAIDKWKERGIGAWMLAAFAFSSFGAAIMYFIKPILIRLFP